MIPVAGLRELQCSPPLCSPACPPVPGDINSCRERPRPHVRSKRNKTFYVSLPGERPGDRHSPESYASPGAPPVVCPVERLLRRTCTRTHDLKSNTRNLVFPQKKGHVWGNTLLGVTSVGQGWRWWRRQTGTLRPTKGLPTIERRLTHDEIGSFGMQGLDPDENSRPRITLVSSGGGKIPGSGGVVVLEGGRGRQLRLHSPS